MVTRVTRKELERIQRMPTEADVARLAEELELAWAERDRALAQRRGPSAEVPMPAPRPRANAAPYLLA